jgi:hypothetical protein
MEQFMSNHQNLSDEKAKNTAKNSNYVNKCVLIIIKNGN